MNKFFSQLEKDAHDLRLSKPEKEAMLLALEAEMRANPLAKSPFVVTPSPYFSFVSPRYASALALVLVLGLGGGSAFAAEGSVPGELLYVVKLGLNEPVYAALATSIDAKASWHAEAAERRMKEAEVLSARGSLTSAIKVELESNLEEHAGNVEESLAAVEDEDPVLAADIAARFESSLAAHSALIARLSLDSDEDENRRESVDFARSLKERERKLAFGKVSVSEGDNTGAIAMRVSLKQDTIALSASTEVSDADDAVVTRLGKNASTTLQEAEVRLDAIHERLSSSTSARVKAQIKGVRKQIERMREGKGSSSDKRTIENALKDATTINVFLEAEGEFEGRALLPSIEVDEANDDHESEKKDDDSGPLVRPLSL